MKKRTLKLPAPWYFTPEELSAEWGCGPERVRYYLDAGLIKAAVLVARRDLTSPVPSGPSPDICVLLEGYRDLSWRHTKDDSEAEIVGAFQALAVDQQWFDVIALTIPAPVVVKRSRLVVLLEEKEHLEQLEVLGFVGGLNPVERRTLLTIIGGLVRADARLAPQGRYSIAKVIASALEGTDARLSEETIAAKIGEAVALVRDKQDDPTLDSPAALGSDVCS